MNWFVPFVCVSGWGCFPRCRWRSSPHCTQNQWWRDAGTGCYPGMWWIGAACELHCSCLGCWMHIACGNSVHILQGAACITIPGREGEDGLVKVRVAFFTDILCAQQDVFRSLTVTFEPLPDEPKQHLPTVVTEGRSSVRVHIERMRSNLEIFKGGCS